MKFSLINISNTSVSRKLRFVTLIFALLFSLCAAAQYLFIRYQLKNADQLEYKKWAKELKQELNYTTKWDLKKFRQADWEAPASYIFTKNGLLIDIYGFVPGLIGQVTLPAGLNYNKPITITSEIGE